MHPEGTVEFCPEINPRRRPRRRRARREAHGGQGARRERGLVRERVPVTLVSTVFPRGSRGGAATRLSTERPSGHASPPRTIHVPAAASPRFIGDISARRTDFCQRRTGLGEVERRPAVSDGARSEPSTLLQPTQPGPGRSCAARTSETYLKEASRASPPTLRAARPAFLNPNPMLVQPSQRSHGGRTAASPSTTATSTCVSKSRPACCQRRRPARVSPSTTASPGACRNSTARSASRNAIHRFARRSRDARAPFRLCDRLGARVLGVDGHDGEAVHRVAAVVSRRGGFATAGGRGATRRVALLRRAIRTKRRITPHARSARRARLACSQTRALGACFEGLLRAASATSQH